MHKIKGLMALSLFALPMLVACPAPEEEAPSEERVSCDPEKPTDCPDDQSATLRARVCGQRAMVEDACGGELDSCGTEAPFVNICECTTTATCGDEEVCHPVTHLCEDICDPMDDQCPQVGDEQWVCYAVEGESYEVDEGDAGVMTYDVYACQPPICGNEICDDTGTLSGGDPTAPTTTPWAMSMKATTCVWPPVVGSLCATTRSAMMAPDATPTLRATTLTIASIC